MASVTRSTYEDGKNYAQIINEMKAAGIKTTGIRQGREADFEDYGNALSSNVKHMIMDSYDCDQDYVLQNQIAGLFAKDNCIEFKPFVNACKSLGLTISRESVSTSYISDYKGGNFSNSVRNGHITVYTISDGKGGEIKIADTNGNGAIESEELFMNKILGDINAEISAVTPTAVSQGSSGASGVNGINEKKITQDEYNRKVEEYLRKGKFSTSEAELKANIDLNTSEFSYTGVFDEKTNEIDQNDYNKKVEEYLFGDTTIEEAQKRADAYFGVNSLLYTGNGHADKHVSQEDYNREVEQNLKNNDNNFSDAITKADNFLNVEDMSYTGDMNLFKEKYDFEKENLFV